MNIIVINDLRAKPSAAAISLQANIGKGNAEIWVSEEAFKKNDFGQNDSLFVRTVKRLLLHFFSGIKIIRSEGSKVPIQNETGVKSSLLSITSDVTANQSAYPEIYSGLERLDRGAESIANKLALKAPDAVYIFNGRLASSYKITRLCQEKKIKTWFYEYGKSKNSFLLLPFPPHNTKKLGESILRNYINDVTPFVISYRKGQEYVKKKLNNKFTKFYRAGQTKSYDAVVFLSSPHEYMSLDQEICGVSRISEIDLVKAIHQEKGPDSCLAVRCHPNTDKDPSWGRYFRNLKIYCEEHNIDFYSPANDTSSYNLIRSSKEIVTDMSSIALDAFFMGKDVSIRGEPSFKRPMLEVKRRFCTSDRQVKELAGALAVWERKSVTRFSKSGSVVFVVFLCLEKAGKIFSQRNKGK